MEEQALKDAVTKLRLHLKADPELAERVSTAIGEAAQSVGVELPRDFFEKLVLVHQDELDTAFSVTTLPVGSQCGL